MTPPILILTPALPHPPNQGAALRNWGLLRGLARIHPVWLLSFGDSESITPELRAVCQRVVAIPAPKHTRAQRLRAMFLSQQADLELRGQSELFDGQLRAWLAEQSFLAVQVEGLEMASHIPFIKQLRPNLPIVYDAHNAETLIQQRAWEVDRKNPRRWLGALYSAWQLPRIAALERRIGEQADQVLCVSSHDAQSLSRAEMSQPLILIPNGLSLSEYRPSSPSASSIQILFIGKLDYRPNTDAVLWFARDIFPMIRAQVPQAEFVVVGKSPPPAILALHQEGIRVIGDVPTIRPYLESATIYVAPLRMGGGTRFKILEAFASEIAVVSTRIGAEGFDLQTGRELLLEDDGPGFAAAVIRLAQQPALRQALGQHARIFCQRYDWENILPPLLAWYQSVV